MIEKLKLVLIGKTLFDRIMILLLVIVLAVFALYFGFLADVGTHSRYFARRDFNNAFAARQTGNCDLFESYMVNDQDKWNDRCVEESKSVDEKASIESFSIENITVNGNKAFLQVKLKRDLFGVELEEGKKLDLDYTANYTMEKTNERFFGIPKTKWVITNKVDN
ncbi:MAG: hypothetical protein WD187_02395 [Candidatus Woykebacteria bacterium]